MCDQPNIVAGMSVGKSDRRGQFVPKLEEESDYLDFKREVIFILLLLLLLWQGMTNMEEDQRAPISEFRLPKKAKKEVIDMSREELSQGVTRTVGGEEVKVSGVMRLLEVLDSIYLEDLHREKFRFCCQFRNLKRTSSKENSSKSRLIKVVTDHDSPLNILKEEEGKKELLSQTGLELEEEADQGYTTHCSDGALEKQIKKIVLRTSSTEVQRTAQRVGLLKW